MVDCKLSSTNELYLPAVLYALQAVLPFVSGAGANVINLVSIAKWIVEVKVRKIRYFYKLARSWFYM